MPPPEPSPSTFDDPPEAPWHNEAAAMPFYGQRNRALRSDGRATRQELLRSSSRTKADTGHRSHPSEHVDRRLQEGLASIAHELRTPLNAILGYSEVIKDGLLGDNSERSQEFAHHIHDSGIHLREIVDSLVELAINDDERSSLEVQKLDVRELIGSALRIVEHLAREADVRLMNEMPGDLPAARGEGRAVRQILLNLLTNAIKYTPPDGSVGIESERMLKLIVWDTGIGIAPENQEKVFQKAYRAPQVRLGTPGSGLGLAISRQLARAMGGDITLESEPGKGSRVTLWLPLEN